MLYLEVNYNRGFIFTDTRDAFAFADALSRAAYVRKEGYGDAAKYTLSEDESPLRVLESVKQSQIMPAPTLVPPDGTSGTGV